MKKRKEKRIWSMMLCVCVFCTLLSGCGNSQNTDTKENQFGQQTESSGAGNTTITVPEIDVETEESEDSLNTKAETDAAANAVITADETGFSFTGQGVTLNQNVITITSEGVYRVSGMMSDGQIIVDAAKGTEITLILDGLDLTCTFGAPIYVSNAGTMKLTIADGTVNRITQTADYSYTDTTTDEQNAAIFSADDLVINGTGTLYVTGNYYHGIKSKDTLSVKKATILVNAKEDAIHVNDDFTMTSGSLTLNAGDDGIHADLTVTIAGGTILIEDSYEGIESAIITISDGNITLNSSDDGMNAASSDTNDIHVYITGGTLHMTAYGDGLDSNGSVEMSGGTVTICGPTNDGNGSIDYEDTFIMTGGTIITAGSSGMAMTTSDTSTQNGLMVYYTSSQAAGTEVALYDAENNLVVDFSPVLSYNCVYISTAVLEEGETYTLYGDNTLICEVTLSGTNTCISSDGSTVTGGMGGMGGMRPGGMNPGGGRPDNGNRQDRW